MITLVSPAKNLDFDTPPVTEEFSIPKHLDQSKKLIKALKKLSKEELSDLMKISPQLSDLNHHRYSIWDSKFDLTNAKQAILAFNGEVYNGLQAEKLSKEDFDFAENHFRILSGLHGLLKPLDLIQPYRLEMGTKFGGGMAKNLYEIWRPIVTADLNEELAGKERSIILNLASNEYFKAVDQKKLNADVITPTFKDNRGGNFKVIMMYAKKMRGAMARFAIQNRISDPEELKAFNQEGYSFNESMTENNNWVFTR